MKPIIWKDEYSVGVKKLDDQHLKLINAINELIELGAHGETISKEHSAFQAMLHFARGHLHYEEFLLKKYHFPDIQTHQDEHLEYLNKMEELTARLDHSEAVSTEECINFIRHWFMDHILVEDMKYKKYFEENNISI